MNSVNHSLESFDSCGRDFFYDSTFVCEAIESKSVFIPKTILLFFQVLGYLMICSLRRS